MRIMILWIYNSILTTYWINIYISTDSYRTQLAFARNMKSFPAFQIFFNNLFFNLFFQILWETFYMHFVFFFFVRFMFQFVLKKCQRCLQLLFLFLFIFVCGFFPDLVSTFFIFCFQKMHIFLFLVRCFFFSTSRENCRNIFFCFEILLEVWHISWYHKHMT